MQEAPPPPPAIGTHILIGLNSVTRHLEALAAQSAPATMPASEKENRASGPDTRPSSTEPTQEITLKPLSIVVITHNHPPASLPHAHIPALLHLSTLSSPSSTPTRPIAVPLGYEPRLASVLHIPHVGAIGIMAGAPGARALEDYVREHVGVTECRWIEEAMDAEWKGVNIETQKG